MTPRCIRSWRTTTSRRDKPRRVAGGPLRVAPRTFPGRGRPSGTGKGAPRAGTRTVSAGRGPGSPLPLPRVGFPPGYECLHR